MSHAQHATTLVYYYMLPRANPSLGATTSYMNLSVDDGLSWADAKAAMEAALADMRLERAPPAVMAKVGDG